MTTHNTTNVRLYESWVKEHSHALYGVAYRLCGRSDLAEDLTQETFYEAWKSLDNLADRTKGKAWLFQILRHRWSHYLRDRSRRVRITTNHDFAKIVARADLIGHLTASEMVSKALRQVDAPLKAPLVLLLSQGYTCSETARALGLPIGTVLSRIHRAKAVMRCYLQKEESVLAS